MNQKCWAHSLGGCDSLSGEHVVSNAVLKQGCGCPTVIEGVPVIRGGAPTRGAFKSNVLCCKHNSLLSPLDEVAAKVARHLHMGWDDSYCSNINIRGELLERWGLKTIVNMAAAGWLGPRRMPLPELVAAIYGEVPLPYGCGLYSVDGSYEGSLNIVRATVAFTGMYEMRPTGKVLIGGYIAIHGMPLFFALSPNVVHRVEAGNYPAIQSRIGQARLRHLYRPGAIVCTRQSGPPIIIGVSWNGVLRYSDGTTAKHIE